MRNITTVPTFIERVGYCVTCVIPAELLSDEPVDQDDPSSLRKDASRDGLSYIQVIRLFEDAVYMVRAAACPEGAANGFKLLLSEEQLYHALPWDHRLSHQQQRPKQILKTLHAHASAVRPLKVDREAEEPALTRVHAAASSLTPIDSVEVSQREVQDAIELATRRGRNETVRSLAPFHVQQALLAAMIDTLMNELYHTQEYAKAVILKSRCALLAQIQRWHRAVRPGRIVNLIQLSSSGQDQERWQLLVGLPA